LSWSREFDESIPLPDGRPLVTLSDAASCITGLPKNEAALPEWLAAIEPLMLVVELSGPMMFARIGVMQALNLHHVREFKFVAQRASLVAEKAQERLMTGGGFHGRIREADEYFRPGFRHCH
jgi:hypothetical protein